MRRLSVLSRSVLFLAVCLLLTSCQSIRQLTALRDVAFAIDRVTDVRLAGIDLNRVQSVNDIRPVDILNLTRALNRREMPLSFNVNVEATNPAENNVTARLVSLDWTLLLQDKETITGAFNGDVSLPPGQPQMIPFGVSLDLVEFFDGGVNDMVQLALAVAGQEGSEASIQLRGTPSINTALGPIRYPQPITIVRKDIGSRSDTDLR